MVSFFSFLELIALTDRHFVDHATSPVVSFDISGYPLSMPVSKVPVSRLLYSIAAVFVNKRENNASNIASGCEFLHVAHGDQRVGARRP